MPTLPEELKAIPYFRDLEPRVLECIRGSVFEAHLDKGQILFTEGEPAEARYVVRTGHEKICKVSPDGCDQVLRIMGPSECFNEVPVFDEGQNPAIA